MTRVTTSVPDAVRDLAAGAARAAGVTLRPVEDVAGIAAVADFFCDVWRTPRSTPPYPAEVLHSLVHAGGVVHGAYDGTRLAGAAVAVFGAPADEAMYSFVAAAAASDGGVGHGVKQAQRIWALERGARTMRWTFDPLVGRNARFNLVKLGALGTEYLVDFYGRMADGVNDGDESDRLTVTWDLVTAGISGAAGATATAHGAAKATAEVPAPDAEITHRAPDGGPLATRDADGLRIHCRVPADVVELRAAQPELALHWRHAVREVLTSAFAEGFRATGMSRDGWYTLTHSDREAVRR